MIPVKPVFVGVFLGEFAVKNGLFFACGDKRLNLFGVEVLCRLNICVPGFFLDIFDGGVHECFQFFLRKFAVIRQRVVKHPFIVVELVEVGLFYNFHLERRFGNHAHITFHHHRIQHGAENALDREFKVKTGFNRAERVADFAGDVEIRQHKLRRRPIKPIPANFVQTLVGGDH